MEYIHAVARHEVGDTRDLAKKEKINAHASRSPDFRESNGQSRLWAASIDLPARELPAINLSQSLRAFSDLRPFVDGLIFKTN